MIAVEESMPVTRELVRPMVEVDGTVAIMGHLGASPLEIATELCDALGPLVGSEFKVVGARATPVADNSVAFVSLTERSPQDIALRTGVASGRHDSDAVVEAVLRAVFDAADMRNVLHAGITRMVREGDVEAGVVTSPGRPRADFGTPSDGPRLEQLAAMVPAGGRLIVQTIVRPYRALSTGTTTLALAVADRDGAQDRIDRWFDGVLHARSVVMRPR
jgi:hypothetical protein